MSNLAKKWLNKLQNNGYRLTESRRVVIEVLANSNRTLNPAEVFDRARERYTALGLVTVYRTLAKLEELDLIQQVHQPDGCEAYIASVPGHQHLLICRGCGRTEYFWGDKLDGLMTKVESESGFLIQDHWLQLFGLCADCQKKAEGEQR